jgi:anti-sigma regulatory factor (Ser/Thr protein kinase)/ActR/RegA family two-component response regulator
MPPTRLISTITILLELPMSQEHQLALPPEKTALVVGPQPELALEVSYVLEGWKVERANSNQAALKLVESRPFDLIVTGENTTGQADVELLRKIRSVRPHTRLIIVTNQSTPVDVIASIRERAFSYFTQPFSSSSFAAMLRLAAEEECWDDGIEVLSAIPEWIKLAARCDKKTADRLVQFFHEIIDLPESERDAVGYAFSEMLYNAIEYGGRFDPSQYVEISYVRAQHVVGCRIKDPGEGFSLAELKHAAVNNPAEDPLRHQLHRDASGLRPGGFGMLITLNLVDELIYGERGNDVLLIKYLDLAKQIEWVKSKAKWAAADNPARSN